jgi:hypothetical protein
LQKKAPIWRGIFFVAGEPFVVPIDVIAGPNVHPQVTAIGPTQVRKRLRERGGGEA